MLTTASLFAAVLAAATVISTWQAIRAKQALTQVQEEQGKTKAALAQAQEQRARAEQREQLALDAVKKFRDAVQANPELKNRPELDALRKALLKEPLEFFRKLRDQLQTDRDTRPEALARLASAAFDLATLTDEIGDKQDALQSFQESLTIRERSAHDNPNVPAFQRDLADSHHHIAVLLCATGKPQSALESYTKALDIRERLVRENPGVPAFQRDLAASHTNIGLLQRALGRLQEALASYRKALAIRKQIVSEDPHDAKAESDLARVHNNLGLLQQAIDQPDQALAVVHGGAEDPRSTRTRAPRHYGVPGMAGREPLQYRVVTQGDGPSTQGPGVVQEGTGDSRATGAREAPATRHSRAPLPTFTPTSRTCCRILWVVMVTLWSRTRMHCASRSGWFARTRGPWSSRAVWRGHTAISATCCATPATRTRRSRHMRKLWRFTSECARER